MKRSPNIPKILLIASLFIAISSCKPEPRPAQTIKVKVAVVIQDPVMPGTDGLRMHEVIKTPGYTFTWNDPFELTKEYEAALEEISHGVVDFEIVKIYDDSLLFSNRNDNGEPISMAQMIDLLQEPEWETLKTIGSHFDYKRFVEHYNFDLQRDQDEINEVWVWSFPYGGMWESNYVGDKGFWLNSDPTTGTRNEKLLVVMGLNYERKMSLALESFGHRFESVMWHEYGRWEKDAPDPNNWEIYTRYDKTHPGKAQVGNIHFPPNGVHDYDWINETVVTSFADDWAHYPKIGKGSGRSFNCTEWACSHDGYMRFWFSHIPHFAGVNRTDGHLNNWWHYVVNYEAAQDLE